MNYPLSTYRIQLNSSFTFKDLSAIIDYLHLLGITTVYAAPLTASVKDSVHGYDVTDYSILNPQIGTLEELQELADKLKAYGMTWLQDIVPNHMAFSSDNFRLMDVLERGAHSPFYNYFDIDWNHPSAPGKILIPDLEGELNECIEKGALKIEYTDKGFKVCYADHQYPLSIYAFEAFLQYMQKYEVTSDLIHKIEAYKTMAEANDLDVWTTRKENFITSLSIEAGNYKALQDFLEALNKDYEALRVILYQQAYVLTYWKNSETSMNYRRFFAVNTLISLQMQEDTVFNDYHTFLLSLYRKGLFQGFRLDHIDGLYDPLGYMRRLRESVGKDCYLIVEKILDFHEELPDNWPVQGTSGYEFLGIVNKVLTNSEGSHKMVEFYKSFTGIKDSYQDIVYEKKKAFLYDQMQGEHDNLMRLVEKLGLIKEDTEENNQQRKALGAFMAAFPIYRIYPEKFPLNDHDILSVEKAYDLALQKEPSLEKELFFIKELFKETDDSINEQKLTFIKRLMQYTGPLAAKGVEDTTFYVYNPLISHNEVGDAPSTLKIAIDEFHQMMLKRQQKNPYSLNATSTHDTKRGEDARMRINMLTLVSEEWQQLVVAWNKENDSIKQIVDGKPAPSLNDEYFIYQSLLGSYPEEMVSDENFMDRTKKFIVKALREAKVETNYALPNEAYEEACIHFITEILSSESPFLTTFIPFLKKITSYAIRYSIIEATIKMTTPGIPDFYQGSELWNLSYVDPDNRRAVDFNLRESLLMQCLHKEQQNNDLIDFLKENQNSGVEKLFIIHKVLMLRNRYKDVFLKGEYVPILVMGKRKDNVLAYLRRFEQSYIMVIILLSSHNENNRSAELSIILPEGVSAEWINIFTNETIRITNQLPTSQFSKFPVAVFEMKALK